MQLELSARLREAHQALHTHLPAESHEPYKRLLESFLAGRLTKVELELALRTILGPSLALLEQHNKYVGAILEALAAVESVAMAEWQREQESRAIAAAQAEKIAIVKNLRDDACESATLSLTRWTLTPAEVSAIEEARARPPIVRASLKGMPNAELGLGRC